MEFNELAEYFDKIQRTSSRLEMIDILSDMFKAIANLPDSDNNLRCAVYFTQGRINSEISIEPKLGVAEKQLIGLLSEKVAKSLPDIRKIVKMTGDIGEAAQGLIEQHDKLGSGLRMFITAGKKEGQNESEAVPQSPSKEVQSKKEQPDVDKEPKKSTKQFDLFSFTSGAAETQTPEAKNKKDEIENKKGPKTKVESSEPKKEKSNGIKQAVKPQDDYIRRSGSISIYDVHRELEKISKVSGANSTRDKSSLILGIMSKITPVAVKYLFNIINGTLRTGVSSMSIIDGLALAFTDSKDKRDEIEMAYYLMPDLGEVAVILKNEGLEGLAKLGISIGIPIKMMLASRVPYKEIPEKMGIPFYAEYKYDGERVQVHKKGAKITLFSRHLRNISDMYPDVIEAVSTQINVEDIVFEGEIVAMDSFYEKMLPFQVVSVRRRKYNVEEMVKKVKVTLFAFDLLYMNKGQDSSDAIMVMNMPLEERRKILKDTIKNTEQLRVSEGKYIHSLQEMVDYFKQAREDGAEGIMNKSIAENSLYRPGNRGFLWIKLKGLEGGKLLDTIDVVIIGGTYGQGKRAGMLSGILCAVYNQETDKFESLTNLGTGFDEETLTTLTKQLLEMKLEKKPKNILSNDQPDIWVPPEIIMEIAGDEITISQVYMAGADYNNGQGFSVRFPVFQRFRDDKGIKEITSSLEIKQMFDSQ